MGILENIKILEAKIDKEIFIAKQLMEENGQLAEEKEQLKEKVAVYEKRIEELEELIAIYKEEKQAIASGILSALNRLNEFDDAVEKKHFPVSEEPVPEAAEAVPEDLDTVLADYGVVPEGAEGAETAGSPEPEQGEESPEPQAPVEGEAPAAVSEPGASLGSKIGQ